MLEEELGVTFPPGDQLHTEGTNRWLRELLAKVRARFHTEAFLVSGFLFFFLATHSTTLSVANHGPTPACLTNLWVNTLNHFASHPLTSVITFF